MNWTLLLGIVAIVAGIAILIWPALLYILVALALIIGGIYAIYVGTTAARAT